MATNTNPALIPLGKAPPGYTQDLVNPSANRGLIYVAVASTALALTVLCVVLRMIVRLRFPRRVGLDDVSVVIAMFLNAAYTGIVIRSTKFGVGRHVWDVPLAWLNEFTQLSKATSAISKPAILFTKLSLLLLYLRVFAPNAFVRYASFAGIVCCTTFYTTAMILTVLLDNNLRGMIRLNHSFVIINTVTDFYILLLPMVAIPYSKLELKRKLGLAVVFFMGLTACGLSITSATYFFGFSYNSNADTTWPLVPLFIINTIEVDLGIACACLPIIPALFHRRRTDTTDNQTSNDVENEKKIAASAPQEDGSV